MAKRKTHEEFIEEMRIINPNVEILGKYIGVDKKIECECLICKYKWSPRADSLLRGSGCPICAKQKVGEQRKGKGTTLPLSNDVFVDKVKAISPYIIPLKPYINAHTKILFKCLKDGYEWLAEPTNILQGKGCPVCANRKILVGTNDLLTTHPHIKKYLANVKDGNKCVSGSTKKIRTRCPDCGFEKDVCIHSLVINGFSCTRCSDNLSYPNKFIRAFIEQLNVKNIQYEYSPSWANLYKYDLYFEYKNFKYIVEMDGGFHYIATNLRSDDDFKIQIKRDEEKELLAKLHNVNIIHIDCRKSDLQYIKANIENSILSTIFDLTNINWSFCNEMAVNNLVKTVCSLYNNGNINKDISQKVGLGRHTVTKYLKLGKELGWCNYIPKKINRHTQ